MRAPLKVAAISTVEQGNFHYSAFDTDLLTLY